jgi:D-glycero-alpha-D-manno-heptose-7-phosphate kinase
MIVSKCPLRISLVGGSTDLEAYLDAYQEGSVIGFPCTLYTYVTLNERNDGHYKINYSKDEYVRDPSRIVNDIAREVIRHFNLPPITICFNADIPSTGSGLASSSSYLIAMISAVAKYLNLGMSQVDICKLALKLERNFNPLTGYQDLYGCGVGGFKKMDFRKSNSKVDVAFKYLNADILSGVRMYLVSTKIVRSSSNILSTIDISKSKNLIQDVIQLDESIAHNNPNQFWSTINQAWINKKQTSPDIVNEELISLEESIRRDHPTVLGMKLCGAGGGGYFLVFSESEVKNGLSIGMDNEGVKSYTI